ncbi:thioredoxin-2-like [Anastrepha ludens]|uniref:thioredoxin-2-like n=1 Tax=Anastrepha ludens TaxID=28586 RepID=UPI0023AFC3CB|nr:thioredoxin-2-like [Anastrepha ludens]
MVYIIQNKEDLDKKIEEARSSGQLVVIDFFANWCGPCKIISPKLEELATQYADKAVVVKVNVDDCEEIALEYNVNSMPTFVFIKDNHIIDVFVGGNSEKLVKNMEKYVGEPIPIENMPEIAEAEQILEEEQPVLD